jgi:hypothetical protein
MRFAAGCKHEPLDPEEIALDQQEFVFMIIAAFPKRLYGCRIGAIVGSVPSPQCDPERCGRA